MDIELLHADPRRMAIRPGALDKHMANAAVAGLGDRAAADRCAGRSLARNEAQISHKLSWGLKPRDVAHLGREGCRYDEIDTAQRRKIMHQRLERPSRQELLERGFDTLDPFAGQPERIEALRNLGEGFGQPVAVEILMLTLLRSSFPIASTIFPIAGYCAK